MILEILIKVYYTEPMPDKMKECVCMGLKKEKTEILVVGLGIGVIAALLVLFGNPVNMGFCIACFLRDTAGALGLHQAANVQDRKSVV